MTRLLPWRIRPAQGPCVTGPTPLAAAIVRSRPRVRARYGLGERFILHVGSISRKKNLLTLLRAFERLAERGYPGQLVLVGRQYGKGYDRPRSHGSPIGNARKCHFCLHRVAVGMLPACVTTCIGRATIFGDRNDAESLVFEMIGSARAFQLKAELGTQPAVYYLA